MVLPYRIQKRICQFRSWYRVPRATNAYATHVPVLSALSHLLKVKKVLEFGSGYYSTLTFLNPQVFPHLQYLHSYENDPPWYAKMRIRTSEDERILLTCVNQPLHTVVSEIDLAAYDLIFIDNATKAALRAKTIEQVVQHHLTHNVIVVHDFEVEAYRRVARFVPQRYTISALNPHTGILWEDRILQMRQLRQVNKIIKRYASQTSLDDAQRWYEIFAKIV